MLLWSVSRSDFGHCPALLEPASELYTAEQWYPKTALPELLGVPVERVDDNGVCIRTPR